jgi:hypothetical protein
MKLSSEHPPSIRCAAAQMRGRSDIPAVQSDAQVVESCLVSRRLSAVSAASVPSRSPHFGSPVACLPTPVIVLARIVLDFAVWMQEPRARSRCAVVS